VPLVTGASKAAMETNIRRELAAGRPQKQAVAIAYAMRRKAKKK